MNGLDRINHAQTDRLYDLAVPLQSRVPGCPAGPETMDRSPADRETVEDAQLLAKQGKAVWHLFCTDMSHKGYAAYLQRASGMGSFFGEIARFRNIPNVLSGQPASHWSASHNRRTGPVVYRSGR